MSIIGNIRKKTLVIWHYGIRGTVEIPWYLKGGIPKANCIAAYKAIGAASLAASYINLVNPGTYNIIPVIAPTLNVNGWAFDGSTQYLSTGITPSTGSVQTWTMICRFSNAIADGGGYGFVMGSDGGSGDVFCLNPRHTGADFHNYANGLWGVNRNGVAGRLTSGIMAVAGGNCYLDGASDGTFAVASLTSAIIYIGGTPFDKYLGSIQACAIYNTVLTATQITAISEAMRNF